MQIEIRDERAGQRTMPPIGKKVPPSRARMERWLNSRISPFARRAARTNRKPA